MNRPITFATLVYAAAFFILFFMPACSLLTCPEKGCAEPVTHYGEGRGPSTEAPAASAEAPAASAPSEAPAPSEGKGHGGHHGKGDHDDGDHDDGDDDGDDD